MLIKLQSISDVGAEQYVVKPVDLKVILESSVQTYSEAIEANRAKVILKVDAIPSFFTYPAFFKIIVDNLLENCMAFSKSENATVKMEARERIMELNC
jgi:signal transduction histidine kinase